MKNIKIPVPKRKKINRLKTLLMLKRKEFRKACSSFKKTKKAKIGGHLDGYDSPEFNESLWFHIETKRDCKRAIRRLQSRLQQELIIN